MGMPGREVIATYHLHAAHCAEIAKRTSDIKNRLVLLKMAAAWLTLAEQAERRIAKSIRTRSRFSRSNNPQRKFPKHRTSRELVLVQNGNVRYSPVTVRVR